MISRIKILILGILLFFANNLNAQTAAAALDTNTILIGDQINLNLSFTSPASYKVFWPLLNDTITDKIEIIEKSKIDTSFSKNKKQLFLTQKIKITSFDSGYYAIPPFKFEYKKVNDTITHFKETNTLLLNVQTIPVDTTKVIKDIKAPLEAPVTFKEILPWLLAAVAAILITLLIIYYIRKRRKAEPLLKLRARPKRPSYEIALEELEKLKERKLWQSGKIKEYHTALTDIIRNYIDSRFSIHAVEMTSEEILDSVNEAKIDEDAKSKLRQLLVLADLVKFAKEHPLPEEHNLSLSNAIDFVKKTILTVENKTENNNQEKPDDIKNKEENKI